MRPLLQAYARRVTDHPLQILLAAVAVGGVLIYWATQLGFDARFHALLPEDTPEILECNELQERAGGTVELVIALQGPDYEAKLAFGRKLSAALTAQRFIQRADVEWPIDFFLDRRLMLMPLERLKRLAQAVDDEVERAKARANPLYVDLEEEEDRPRPWAEVDASDTPQRDSMLRRTFTSPDDKYLFVRIKPMGSSMDIQKGKGLLGRIKQVVRGQRPEAAGIRVRYAGSLEMNQLQNEVMSADFSRAAVIALVAIIALLTLYIRRLFAPVVLAVPLLLGVGSTLGITSLAIGQLNLVSGMLVSALFGLGIDFEIHLYLRYLEELTPGRDRREAMRVAITRTLPGCTTAATTTAAAFFAMAISDFKGYREYGLIAGMGVLVTLLMTYVSLPPLALWLSRRGRPPRPGAGARNIPRRLALAMVAVGGAALLAALLVAPRVRWHNDFKALRGNAAAVNFSYYVGDLLGGSLSPAAVLVKDLDQARRVHDHLEPRMGKPGAVVKRALSLASMVPRDMAQKLPILQGMERTLTSVADQKLNAEDRKRVQDALRLVRVKPWGVAEIPEVFRKQFQTLDGAEQFVVLWPAFPTHVDEKIIAWGEALNHLRAELRAQGLPVKILDENRIAARVLRQMREDAPLVLAAAGLAVVLLLLADFRKPARVLLVAGTLGVGLCWMLGLMAFNEIWINVFNQAVLATIIGVGIDNVVHIEHRYLDEGPGSLPRVISTTGAAALLASATTAIGFGAAISAHHLGIQSLGWLSIVGLSSTFVASTVFFPCVLRLMERDP